MIHVKTKSPLTKKACLLLTAFALLFVPHILFADYDPPGQPAIRNYLSIESITLSNNQDDGIDANSEVVLTYYCWVDGHWDHTYESGVKELTVNCSSSPTVSVGEQCITHEECTAMGNTNIFFSVHEADAIGVPAEAEIGCLTVELVLALSGIGLAADLALLIPHLVTMAHDAVNDAEDLGTGSGNSAAAGTFTTTTTGADGSAKIEWKIESVDMGATSKCGVTAPCPCCGEQLIGRVGGRTEKLFIALERYLANTADHTQEATKENDMSTASSISIASRTKLMANYLDGVLTYAMKHIKDTTAVLSISAITHRAKKLTKAGDPKSALQLYKSACVLLETTGNLGATNKRLNICQKHWVEPGDSDGPRMSHVRTWQIVSIAIFVIALIMVILTRRSSSRRDN